MSPDLVSAVRRLLTAGVIRPPSAPTRDVRWLRQALVNFALRCDAEIGRLRDDLSRLTESIDALARDKAIADAEVQRLLGERAALAGERERLAAHSEELQGALDALARDKATADAEVQRLLGELAALAAEREPMAAQIDDPQSTVHCLQSDQEVPEREVSK